MWAACPALHFFKALECPGLEALPTWALNFRSKCVPKNKKNVGINKPMWHLAQRIPCFHSFKDGQIQSVFGHHKSSKGFLLAKRSIYMPCGSYLSCGLTGKPFTAMLAAHDSCKRCTELGTSVSNKGIKRQQMATRKILANHKEAEGKSSRTTRMYHEAALIPFHL